MQDNLFHQVMAIGRTFEESLQKALRMTHPTVAGFTSKLPAGKDHPEGFSIDDNLRIPNNSRIHTIAKVKHIVEPFESYINYSCCLVSPCLA